MPTKKRAAQLERQIAEALARPASQGPRMFYEGRSLSYDEAKAERDVLDAESTAAAKGPSHATAGRRSHATKTARSKPVSKPGPHGTLYRYSIVYTDQGDAGFGEATWNTWAYDPQHAVDRFYESPDGDTGWVALRIARQQESLAHRWTWHPLGR